MKKILNFFQEMRNSTELSLQERLFRLLSTFGLAGLIIGLLAGGFSGAGIKNIIPLFVFIFLLAVIVFCAIRFKKIQLGAVLISVVVIYLVLPYNFLTSGGLYGGAPIWFLFGFIFVSLVVEGKGKYVLIASGYAIYLVCCYIAYAYPADVVQHTVDMTYVDAIISLTVVTVLTCAMILFQNSVYRAENDRAEEQRKEIEELNQAQSRFFSSMSHEIRTPINTIIGLNEMILRENVSEEVAADAQNIQGASKMLLTLINDILDMSKIESGKMDIVPVTYDTGNMLSDIVNMIWVRAREKGLEFHIDVEEHTPAKLFGDEVRIKQILINLLNNSVKYTPEGSVTLSIQCQGIENGIAQMAYSVSDTGMGIKKENIPHLFSAFKRVDEEKNRYIEGTGLGLSIVKQLVDLMGGEITVNSVYTRGSTFLVVVPQKIMDDNKVGELNLESRHAMNVRDHYKQIFEAPKANVLIVDDNETNLMVEEKLLRDTKVNVDTATSGAACLKKTAQNRYHVIFMDHLMPEMDGIQCLHAVRAQVGGLNTETPVVILTANAGSENQALYRREGFDGYLVKPVSGKDLEMELLSHLPKELVQLADGGDLENTIESPILSHKKKMQVMITTDSVCDLPESMTAKNHIVVKPYRVVTEEGDFLDGIEVGPEGILSYMGAGEKVARSEPPEPASYEEFFADQLVKTQQIIHISIAKNTSGGYANALEAAKTFDNVTVVESGHLSSGTGLLVLNAARNAAEGMSVEEILKNIERDRKNVRTSFVVASTKYLACVGRIPSKVDKICEALMLHPIIVLKKSSMTVSSILMGTRETYWRKYINRSLNVPGEIDTSLLFITYVNLTQSELMEIEEMVRKKVNFEKVVYQKASSAISTNAGPGTFGLLFKTKG